MSGFVEAAIEAARIGGEVLLRHRGRLRSGDVSEKGQRDFVTAVDRESEREILRFLRDRYPGHGVLAEESAAAGGDAPVEGYRWVVDPLDGTTNYIHGYPCFGVSVALERDGSPVAGCVLDPVRGEVFAAEEGSGARLCGEPIRVSAAPVLSASLLVTGFPFRIKARIEEYFGALKDLVLASRGMRRDGSAALDLAYVACGRFDGFWELGLSRWDLSAGILIVREAGGVVTDIHGGKGVLESGDVAASNARIQEELLAVLRRHFPAPGADAPR